MKGYVKASRYYYDAVLVRRTDAGAGANYDEVVAITAKYTGRQARAHPHRAFPTRTATAACIAGDVGGRSPGGTRRSS